MPSQLRLPDISFPLPHLANADGLLAVGGDLSPERLLVAYAKGIFPWYDELPVLWWCPDPRFVLFPGKLKVSHSMKKVLKSECFRITVNHDFEQVITRCGEVPRKGQSATWIHNEVIAAYLRLHEMGFAHSVEAWQDGRLAGGLYGVKLGDVFFGESMFSLVANASKAAFITYVRALQVGGCRLIDCQIYSAHLASLGAEFISRRDFLGMLDQLTGFAQP